MKVYVGNLPWSVDLDGLRKLFESFGEIEEAIVITDKFNGRSKGFGFVTFKDDEAGKKAVAEMHEKEIEGRKLNVSEAKPREDMPKDDSVSAQEPVEESVKETSEEPVESNLEEAA